MSPEDLILTKLAWSKETGSERQLRDVEGIVAIAEGLDRKYIETWTTRLGVAEAWSRIAGGELDD